MSFEVKTNNGTTVGRNGRFDIVSIYVTPYDDHPGAPGEQMVDLTPIGKRGMALNAGFTITREAMTEMCSHWLRIADPAPDPHIIRIAWAGTSTHLYMTWEAPPHTLPAAHGWVLCTDNCETARPGMWQSMLTYALSLPGVSIYVDGRLVAGNEEALTCFTL